MSLNPSASAFVPTSHVDGHQTGATNTGTNVHNSKVSNVATDEPILKTKLERSKKEPCRFFTSHGYCRRGKRCPYNHVKSKDRLENQSESQEALVSVENLKLAEKESVQLRDKSSRRNTVHDVNSGSKSHKEVRTEQTAKEPKRPNQRVTTVDPSKTSKRPEPNGNKRDIEISQLRRRFPKSLLSADQSSGDTSLEITMKPSDPDFAHDLDELKFKVTVPKEYPRSDALPRIDVYEIPRGFAANVEIGFGEIVKSSPRQTLLQMINKLDRRLEEFLSQQKRPTFKFVRSVKNNNNDSSSQEISREEDATAAITMPVMNEPATYSPLEQYGILSLKAARTKRGNELHRFKTRMRKKILFSSGFQDEQDTILTVAIDFANFAYMPPSVQGTSQVDIVVPAVYPLENCKVILTGNGSQEARNIEAGFDNRVRNYPECSLLSHFNYLVQNGHKIAHFVDDREENNAEFFDWTQYEFYNSEEESESGEEEDNCSQDQGARLTDGDQSNFDESASVNEDDSHSADASTIDTPLLPESERTKGTALDIPDIELEGVEILECKKLNLNVKCSRCKTAIELDGLISADYGRQSSGKGVNCPKCSQVVAAAFRKEFIHQRSSRIGYLDFYNCTPFYLNLSDFTPTCENCSTPHRVGFKGIGPTGQKQMTNCRKCHHAMSIWVSQFKFSDQGKDSTEESTNFKVSLSGAKSDNNNSNKMKLSKGTSLPGKGTCPHYRKSTRWFRFSCCPNRVFPCDKCHDEAVSGDHPAEHATRMICGACSREQTFNPTQCRYCGHLFINRQTGFWEGGKGVRDRVRMSRKDPRKHKRIAVKN